MLEKEIPKYLQPYMLCDEAVIGTDPNLQIVFWNIAAEMLLGMNASEAKGRLLSEIVHPDKPDFKQAIQKRTETEDSYYEEIAYTDSAGTRIWIDIRIKKA